MNALSILTWSALTIALYLLAQTTYRRWPHWWTMPVVIAPVALTAIFSLAHVDYITYSSSAGWLIILLGPATVAFAIPIYDQRVLIRRHWPILLIGVAVGSITAMLMTWLLGNLLGIEDALQLSLLPRSVSTPFAMIVSGLLGGQPNLTAVFAIVTGIFGAAIGESMIYWLPLKTALARGGLFGMGAQAVGVAKAHQIGAEEGCIAGLVMIMAGVINIIVASLFTVFLK